MQNQARKCFIWLWLFALLTSTVGVSVHSIYCYCTNKTVISLLDRTEKCLVGSPSNNLDACCSKKIQKSCCSTTEGEPKKSKGCTKKTTKIFQLKTEYTLESKTIQSFDFEGIVHSYFYVIPYEVPAVAPASEVFQLKPLPPPLGGKAMRYWMQSLLC